MDEFTEKLKILEQRMKELDKHNVRLAKKVAALLEDSEVALKHAEQLCHKADRGITDAPFYRYSA